MLAHGTTSFRQTNQRNERNFGRRGSKNCNASSTSKTLYYPNNELRYHNVRDRTSGPWCRTRIAVPLRLLTQHHHSSIRFACARMVGRCKTMLRVHVHVRECLLHILTLLTTVLIVFVLCMALACLMFCMVFGVVRNIS